MAGTNILIPLKRGDEVVVYAYTGTWLADFAMNHYTHWVGLLLKVSKFYTLNLEHASLRLKLMWCLKTTISLSILFFAFSQMRKNAKTS